jgi:hypothetical protein
MRNVDTAQRDVHAEVLVLGADAQDICLTVMLPGASRRRPTARG